MEQWFEANKLSLNIKKTKYTLYLVFYSSKDDVLLMIKDYRRL